MSTGPVTVTRLPGAPPRRAGRTWPEGQPVTVTDLTPAALLALRADAGYQVAIAHGSVGASATPAAVLPPAAPGQDVTDSPTRPPRRVRPKDRG